MKIWSLLILLIIFYSCTKVEKQYYPNGSIKSEISYKKELKHGPATYYYNNGKINIKCYYKDDKLNGLYEKFNPDASLEEATNYSNGLKNGFSIIYYKNNKIAIKMNFKNDLPDGDYIEYFDNGQTKISGQYINGYYNSAWSYYDFNGLEVGHANFSNGNGVQIGYYYGTKKKRVEIEFSENIKNGKEIHFNKSGDTIKIIFYSKGEIVEVERYTKPLTREE